MSFLDEPRPTVRCSDCGMRFTLSRGKPEKGRTYICPPCCKAERADDDLTAKTEKECESSEDSHSKYDYE